MANIERESPDLAQAQQAAIQLTIAFRSHGCSIRDMETFLGIWNDIAEELPAIDPSRVDALAAFYESRACIDDLVRNLQKTYVHSAESVAGSGNVDVNCNLGKLGGVDGDRSVGSRKELADGGVTIPSVLDANVYRLKVERTGVVGSNSDDVSV